MNFARGTFIIAPHPQTRELKIARHGFGYRNPASVSYVSSKPSKASLSSSTKSNAFAEAQVSVPRTDTQIPIEAEHALRDALAELFPTTVEAHTKPPNYPESLHDVSQRPFTNTRLCWYTDTPSGNFIIDYPPLPSCSTNKSLFMATGGSGHGFKFFPILGQYVVDAVEGQLENEYKQMWKWPSEQALQDNLGIDVSSGSELPSKIKEFLECEDGSRGGPRGMILEEEIRRGVASVEAGAVSAKL